jgi:hypothetical protein
VTTEGRSISRTALVGLALGVGAFIVYWLSNRAFDAGHGDFFYLADAFLHGRVWIENALGPNDVIYHDGHVYVPFAPLPAVLLMPLVALVGPVTADRWESGINAGLAATVVLLAWWTAGRIGVERIRDRVALVLLLGFSTQVWWVTTRGGVWHTGHLVAMILTLLLLAEMFGRQRAWILGFLVGAAFLSRAPVAFATPALALWLLAASPAMEGRLSPRERFALLPWRNWALLGLGLVPPLVFFFWYNEARFGSRLESGYALAALPEWLENQRKLGLFALAHVRMNVDYLFLKLPALTADFPYFRPDGLGMSVLFTSPGLLLAVRAPWRNARSWILLLAAVLVLIPTLLYYGGGWLQYGYRYFLDSIPFVWAMVAMGIVHRDETPWWGWTLILWGVLIGLGGVYWAYHL